ncbi:MAG: LysM peptidoglycan-binding domain-containing protein [Elusimicrobiota bacterium]
MTFFLIGAIFFSPAQAFGQEAAEGVETAVERAQHEVVVANTLWDLAAHYYGDPWQWPRIHEANTDRIKDPHWIYPGQVIVIPGLNKTVMVVREAPEPAPVVEQPVREEPVEETPPPPPQESPRGDFKSYQAAGGEVLPDSLSAELPKGMAGQQPSAFRLRMPESWKPDGRVAEYLDREGLAAAGDSVNIRVDKSVQVRKGQRFAVYRRASVTDADRDSSGRYAEGQYVQKVGIIEVEKKLSDAEYKGVILQSGGEVQVGDWVKKED